MSLRFSYEFFSPISGEGRAWKKKTQLQLAAALLQALPGYLSLVFVQSYLVSRQLGACLVGLQRYIFPRYDTYLDTWATIRYNTVRDKTSYEQLTLLLINLFP